MPKDQRCRTCTECVDICPVHSFAGILFREADPRDARYDAAPGDRYFQELGASGRPSVCGLCLYICPSGRKKSHHPAESDRN